MALPRIGFNEGSLLRRTLIHVGTFVLGSAAFIGIMSFVLVSIAKGLVTPRAEAAEEDTSALALPGATAGVRPTGAAGAPAPLVRPGAARPGKRPGIPMAPQRTD